MNQTAGRFTLIHSIAVKRAQVSTCLVLALLCNGLLAENFATPGNIIIARPTSNNITELYEYDTVGNQIGFVQSPLSMVSGDLVMSGGDIYVENIAWDTGSVSIVKFTPSTGDWSTLTTTAANVDIYDTALPSGSYNSRYGTGMAVAQETLFLTGRSSSGMGIYTVNPSNLQKNAYHTNTPYLDVALGKDGKLYALRHDGTLAFSGKTIDVIDPAAPDNIDRSIELTGPSIADPTVTVSYSIKSIALTGDGDIVGGNQGLSRFTNTGSFIKLVEMQHFVSGFIDHVTPYDVDIDANNQIVFADYDSAYGVTDPNLEPYAWFTLGSTLGSTAYLLIIEGSTGPIGNGQFTGDDFENPQISSFWSTAISGNDAAWRLAAGNGTHTGQIYQSGDLPSGTTTSKAELTADFKAGILLFEYYFAEPPLAGGDTFSVAIDGNASVGLPHADTWTRTSVPIGGGSHTVAFIYQKANSIAANATLAGIDTMRIVSASAFASLPNNFVGYSPGQLYELSNEGAVLHTIDVPNNMGANPTVVTHGGKIAVLHTNAMNRAIAMDVYDQSIPAWSTIPLDAIAVGSQSLIALDNTLVFIGASALVRIDLSDNTATVLDTGIQYLDLMLGQDGFVYGLYQEGGYGLNKLTPVELNPYANIPMNVSSMIQAIAINAQSDIFTVTANNLLLKLNNQGAEIARLDYAGDIKSLPADMSLSTTQQMVIAHQSGELLLTDENFTRPFAAVVAGNTDTLYIAPVMPPAIQAVPEPTPTPTPTSNDRSSTPDQTSTQPTDSGSDSQTADPQNKQPNTGSDKNGGGALNPWLLAFLLLFYAFIRRKSKSKCF